MNEKLDEIAARAFPEADHRAARCRKALDEAVAEERKALREIVASLKDVSLLDAEMNDDPIDAVWRDDVYAALDAREAKRSHNEAMESQDDD